MKIETYNINDMNGMTIEHVLPYQINVALAKVLNKKISTQGIPPSENAASMINEWSRICQLQCKCIL